MTDDATEKPQEQPTADDNDQHEPNNLEASPGEKLNPDIGLLMDVNMSVSVEIGRAKMTLENILNLSKGAIVELDKLSGEPLDILANGKLIAHGDVISMNGKYGIRLTDVPQKTGTDPVPSNKE